MQLIDLKSDYLDGWYKRRFLDAVVRLSRKSRLYPRSLNITGVDQVTSTDDRGGFSAIFRGELSGRVIALKELQATGRMADNYFKARHFVQWRNLLMFDVIRISAKRLSYGEMYITETVFHFTASPILTMMEYQELAWSLRGWRTGT